MIRSVAQIALLVLLSAAASAHEINTAYLQIDEAEPEVFEVIWKRPLMSGRLPAVEPLLPEECEPLSAPSPSRTGNVVTEAWTTRCAMRTGTIGVMGLQAAHTETIVRISYLNGDRHQQVLRPANPRLSLGEAASHVSGYFVLGVEHLLFGIDHILFVIGLVLFIRDPWMLVKTVTAFTVAHSLTLAASVLDLVRLPQGPVEAVIALSILFLARELMVEEEHRSRLTLATPWIVAFVFGLLHGFGFAGVLREIGLPPDQLVVSLLLFNVGIEVGQLAVIAVMLAGGWLLQRLLTGAAPLLMERGFAAAVGCIAAFWTIDRLVAIG